jgi:hypothetical protein
MTNVETGIGIKLDSDLDISAPFGQIATTTGAALIERDVAFSLVSELGIVRGQVPDADFAAEVEVETRRVLDRDPRIQTVNTISVSLSPARGEADADTVSVAVGVTTATGETEALLIDI